MTMKHIIAYASAGLFVLSAVSCSKAKWTVEGNIKGAEGQELILEAANEVGNWYGIDTVTVADDGSYRFSREPEGQPEIFRLRLGKETAYFPVDSIETVTLDASVPGMTANYTLAGSDEALAMQCANAMVDSAGRANALNDTGFKRDLAQLVMRNPSGMTAYYTIFRRVGGTPLFNPASKADNRIIGAVANAFNEHRPADPRTRMLADLFLSNRAASRPAVPGDTLVAEEISLPEITLHDAKGNLRSLTAEASKGKVIILNFTAYSAQESPAINLELGKIYNANKANGLEIYQIGFDDDEYLWRNSAKNIPWIAVYNSSADGVNTLRDYNVGALPATFIINRQGELVERVVDFSKLQSAVARYL